MAHFVFKCNKEDYLSISQEMFQHTVSHNCFYYTSKPECAIPDDNFNIQYFYHSSEYTSGIKINFGVYALL